MATITAKSTGGNWSAVGTWDTGVVPTAADDVRLASTSGNVTIDANAFCRSLDCTGYTHTLTHNAFVLSVGDGSGGALTLVAGMIYAPIANRTIKFVSTSDNGGSGWGITTGGKTLSVLTFDGVGGKWTCLDPLTTRSDTNTTLTNGTWNTNGQTVSMGKFLSNGSGVRTATMAGSGVTISGSGTCWSIGGTGTLAFSAPTTLTFTDLTATAKTMFFSSLSGFSLTYNAVTFSGGSSGSITFQGPLATCTTGTFGGPNTYLIGATGGAPKFTTIAINGSPGNTITFMSSSAGTLRTITASVSGVATYTTFQDIDARSGSLIDATNNCVNSGNNFGIFFFVNANLSLLNVGSV